MKKNKLKLLWELFLIFFKAGTFTFAGGLAMLPVIEKDVVEKYKVMPREDFLEYATLSQTLPGVIALNCASFVGRRAAGIPGMLCAGFGATVSAFVLMILATVLLGLIPKEGPVAGAFIAIRASSAALVLSAAFTLGRHNIKGIFSVIIMFAAFSAVVFLNVSAPAVVLIAGAAGYFYQRFKTKGKVGI